MPVIDNDIQAILDAAINAPSGDNMQPWRFEWKGKVLTLFLTPGADPSPYNVDEIGSLIAHGALIENIRIAASAFGYDAIVEILPDESKPLEIAQITFSGASSKSEPLFEALRRRATNRRPYEKREIQEAVLKRLRSTGGKDAGVSVRLISDPVKKDAVATALGVNDRLLFEVPEVHSAIFSAIRWSDTEAREREDGLYVKTLELPPPVRLAFPLLRQWQAVRFLKALKFPQFAAKQNSTMYKNSSALGLIAVDSFEQTDIIRGGQIFERLWLTATVNDLHVQPVTGILYLKRRMDRDDSLTLTGEQRESIDRAYNTIIKQFGAGKEFPLLSFRVGFAQEPSAVSIKKTVRLS